MTIYHPLLNRPIRFEENRIQVLVIENGVALRRCLEDLHSQMAGCSGEFILAENYQPIELRRYAALATDPLHPDLDSRRLSGKILQTVEKLAEDQEPKLRQLLAEINDFAAELCMGLDFEATFAEQESAEGLLKLLDFHLDRDSLDLPSLLLEWMRLQRAFFEKRLFILYGLKSLLSEEELTSFYRSVFYEKMELLLIEAWQQTPPREEEITTIIDRDLCVLQDE